MTKAFQGSVAQWLEQGTHKPKVAGSNPARAIKLELSMGDLLPLSQVPSQKLLQELAQVSDTAFTGYWHCQFLECPPECPLDLYLLLVQGKAVFSAGQPPAWQGLLDVVKRYTPTLVNPSGQAAIEKVNSELAPLAPPMSALEKLSQTGLLAPSAIARATYLQLLNDGDHLSSVETLSQAQFFAVPELATQLAALPSYDFTQLIADGQARLASWRSLKRFVPTMTGIPVLHRDALASSGLSDVQQQRLRHLISMGNSLSEIAAAVAEDSLTVANIFAQLIKDGLVKLEIADGERIVPEILVIDDSALVLQQFEHLVRSWGYRVSLVQNPLQAVENMLASLPDIVFLDVNMPDISGFDLVKTIRYQPQLSHIPVVILTSERTLNNNWRAKWSGCHFLSKPVELAEVSKFQLRLKALLNEILA
jgi:CheY-like chemotaxis protein